jgi:hypothetical protein
MNRHIYIGLVVGTKDTNPHKKWIFIMESRYLIYIQSKLAYGDLNPWILFVERSIYAIQLDQLRRSWVKLMTQNTFVFVRTNGSYAFWDATKWTIGHLFSSRCSFARMLLKITLRLHFSIYYIFDLIKCNNTPHLPCIIGPTSIISHTSMLLQFIYGYFFSKTQESCASLY